MAILRRLASFFFFFFFFFAARERLLLRPYFNIFGGGGGRRGAPGQPVANGCDWENQTVDAEPNTRCQLQTVNLLANPHGPVRSKRGLRTTPTPMKGRSAPNPAGEFGRSFRWMSYGSGLVL
jgi:hypothetical protein